MMLFMNSPFYGLVCQQHQLVGYVDVDVGVVFGNTDRESWRERSIIHGFAKCKKMVLGFSHWLGQGKKFGNSFLNRITETPKEENSEFSLLTWTFTINKGKK